MKKNIDLDEVLETVKTLIAFHISRTKTAVVQTH